MFPSDSLPSPLSVEKNNAPSVCSSGCYPEEKNERGEEANRLASPRGNELPCWLQPPRPWQDTAEEADRPSFPLPPCSFIANSSVEVAHDTSSNVSSSPLPASISTNKNRTHLFSTFHPARERPTPCVENKLDDAASEGDFYTSDFEDVTTGEEGRLEIKDEVEAASTPL